MASNKETQTPEVFTAVSLSGDDLERPLLLEEDLIESQSESQINESSKVAALYPAFRVHGMVVGFLAQLINVSGSTLIYYQWGNEGVFSRVWVSVDILDTVLHAAVYVITQVDLYLYLIMWVALTAVLTESGMKFVRERYFEKSGASKRSVFVLGVQFYIGVVVGVFLAWTAIDCVLGLPVPVLPMLGVLVFGLCISYTMIWCYDLEDTFEGDEEYV